MKINFTKTRLILSAFFLAAFLFATTAIPAQAQTISTVAGSANQGYSNNVPATDAELNLPLGVAVDDSGNIYIADEFNDRVRKVTITTGIISTIAGGGSNYGTDGLGDGGPSTNSEMYSPTGIAVDDSGNIFVVDDNRVRKITKATGIINSIAGDGTWSYSGDGGPATAAELRTLTIALTDSGNIYLADFQNNRVRKITVKTGIITTVAGTGYNAPHEGGYTGDGGQATDAELDYPSGVAVDDSGNFYIADDYNQVIRKVTIKTGIITTVAGNGYGQGTSGVGGYTGDGGLATNAELSDPCFIVLDDSSNIYIADRDNERIRKVTATTGIITTFAGDSTGGFAGDGGPATDAELNEPGGMALDVCGNVYTADWGNSRVRKITIVGPSPTNNVLVSSTTVCPGKSITFRDSTNFNATNWNWYFFNGSPDTSTSSNPVITYNKAGTFYITVNAWNQCNSVSNTYVNFVKVTVPSLTIVPPSASVCKGSSVTLDVSGGGSGFTWSPSIGLSATTGDSVIATPTATVTYSVTGIDSMGCTATGTEVVTLATSPNKPTFRQDGDTLISSSKNDNQWYRNDTLLTNDTSQYLMISVLGTYWVVVDNEANGCSTASDPMDISTTTGLKQLSVNNGQLLISPNPSSGLFAIREIGNETNTKLEVYNILGEKIYQSVLSNPQSVIDLSAQAAGMYFVYLKSDEDTAVRKVLLTR